MTTMCNHILFVLLSAILFSLGCAEPAGDTGQPSATTLKYQSDAPSSTDESTDDSETVLFEVDPQEMLESIDMINPQLFNEAQEFLDNGEIQLYSLDSLEGEELNENPSEASSSEYKNWSISGFFDGLQCKKHTWNPAYWSARIIADIGFKFKNSYGFDSVNQCVKVLGTLGTTDCIARVQALLTYANVGWISWQYVVLACATATFSAVECACEVEW